MGDDKGCIDTLTRSLVVNDRPYLDLSFKDTLICRGDTLQLHARPGTPSAIIKWSPAIKISRTDVSDPLVFPASTTTYVVSLTDSSCINTDSVKVNVIDHVTLDVGADTSMCLTDSIQFHPTTDGLYFAWTPTESVNNPSLKNPVSVPTTNTKYTLTASVGKCFATDDINVFVAPYPVASAGVDTSICDGTFAQLRGSITGTSFNWAPSNSLDDPNTLSPVAHPATTTTYILTVTDTLGCPKPVSSSIVVKVIPPVKTFAGNDTNIVANQPLQLHATGAVNYSWFSPAPGMSNTHVPDPIVTLGASYDTVLYVVRGSTPEGCFADDSMKVVVFKTLPEIFVPSAFSPNGDGLNDDIKPVLAGMKSLDFFNIYNRWGQLLFTTSEVGKGWDGTFAGVQQQSGTYVFMAKAIDYSGKAVVRKGTVVLVR